MLGLGIANTLGGNAVAGPSGPTYTVSVSGATTNPTYGATAQIGVALTASATGWSGAAPASVAWLWINATGAGANTATYTPVAGDDLASIYPQATPSDTYAPKNGSALVVRYAPPTAANGLADPNWTENIAISTFDVSADFTASGETYAVQTGTLPTGLSLSSAGLITGTPTEVVADRAIVVRGTNSGGSADTAFSVTVAVAGGDAAVSYGALTLAGHGGVPVPAGATAISGGTATGYTMSGGKVAPTSNGSATAGTMTFTGSGVSWDITTAANTYHITGDDRTLGFSDNNEWTQVEALNTTLIGKTIKLRPGALMGHCALSFVGTTGTLEITSEDTSDKGVFSSLQIFRTDDTNLNIHHVDVDLYSDPVTTAGGQTIYFPVLFDNSGGNGGNDVIIDNCDIRGAYNPADWVEADYAARCLVNSVSGGTPAAGQILHNTTLSVRSLITQVDDVGGGVCDVDGGDF